jgi:hypothetical protein
MNQNGMSYVIMTLLALIKCPAAGDGGVSECYSEIDAPIEGNDGAFNPDAKIGNSPRLKIKIGK